MNESASTISEDVASSAAVDTGNVEEAAIKQPFLPGREDFRQALNAAMPQFLVNGQQNSGTRGEVALAPKDEIRRTIDHVTPRTWKKDKARILQLLEAL